MQNPDRNLLFGILALQMDFIQREQLIAGMQAWVLDKSVPLADHLIRLKSLRSEHRQLLEPLVAAHIQRHDNDPQQNLAALSSAAELCDELAQLDDSGLQATLQLVQRPKTKSPLSTIPNDNLLPHTLKLDESRSHGTRFRILRPHAEGGLGVVYVARDTELGREVALKEIKSHKADDLDNRARFTREAEITGGLEHPGIVPVYGLGAYSNGRPFYAMRFIRGNSLKEAIDRFHRPDSEHKKPLDPTERNLRLRRLLQHFIDVCEAMDYAHSRGVLHRDLKPGNIMLGRHGETLVVDWGLAKPLGQILAGQEAVGTNRRTPNSIASRFVGASVKNFVGRLEVEAASGTMIDEILISSAIIQVVELGLELKSSYLSNNCSVAEKETCGRS